MDEAEIVGNEGTIEIRRYDNQEDEAKDVALQIRNWVEYDAVFLNEIAILISKQPNLYSESLKRELKSYGIPYRNEQEVQDLFCEPIINIILDYILIIYGSREPEAWQRFHSFVIQDDFSERSEIEYQRWQSFIRKQQNLVNRNDDIARIWERIKDMLKEFGIDHIRSLSSDYENIHRLRELLKNLKTQISRSLRENPDLVSAIKSYWEDNSLRILTIHKSKGLEFSKVVILGVEKETFWGNPNDERNAYFVGVSRVKEHLILTYCDHRDVPVSADSQQVRNWRRIRNPQQEFLCYV
jgi:superfamily I DNA/RNA helicase